MSTTWKIGKVTFPVPPERITLKKQTSIKKINVGLDAPWLYSMGPDGGQLLLDGEFIQNGKRLAQLYPSYARPLSRYTHRLMAVPFPILDINPSGTWTKTGSKTVFKATGDYHLKGDVSAFVQFSGVNKGIYYDFGGTLDFSNNTLFSIWVKGDNTSKLEVTFYNEAWSSRANGYRMYPVSSGVWRQTVVAMSSADGSTVFNTVGTPKGWNSIGSVCILPSGATNPGSQGFRIDAGIIGPGWQVVSDGGFYDGIYMLQSFEYEQSAGEIESIKYRIQMVDNTQYYGTRDMGVG